jgi:hypothetical protein
VVATGLGHDLILQEYKTHIWQDRYGKRYWTVTYYMPYSGILSAQFTSWQLAMDEAVSIEKAKVWL